MILYAIAALLLLLVLAHDAARQLLVFLVACAFAVGAVVAFIALILLAHAQ